MTGAIELQVCCSEGIGTVDRLSNKEVMNLTADV